VPVFTAFKFIIFAWDLAFLINKILFVRTTQKTSLSFDAIKPHFAPPMQGLHCTHVLQHEYPSIPHPLFPTYPRTVMAPCVVVERLEGKQLCSRAAVSEHAGTQAREWSRWLFTKKQEVNEKNDQTLQQPTHNHDSGEQTTSCSSALVQGRSTQFIANPCRWPPHT